VGISAILGVPSTWLRAHPERHSESNTAGGDAGMSPDERAKRSQFARWQKASVTSPTLQRSKRSQSLARSCVERRRGRPWRLPAEQSCQTKPIWEPARRWLALTVVQDKAYERNSQVMPLSRQGQLRPTFRVELRGGRASAVSGAKRAKRSQLAGAGRACVTRASRRDGRRQAGTLALLRAPSGRGRMGLGLQCPWR
jgi:hypothetical protein